MSLSPKQLAERGLLELKWPVTPRFLPLKNSKGKADEPRPTDTHRSPTSQVFTYTAHRRGGSAPNAPRDGRGAGGGIRRRRTACPARPPKLPEGRRLASGRPGAERSAVRLQGQRRLLLARLAQPAAFGGRGVLWLCSGPWAPPPAAAAAAPAARSSRVRAPSQASRAPQVAALGCSAPGRALCGSHSSTGLGGPPPSRRPAPGIRQGRGTTALTPITRSAAASPAGFRAPNSQRNRSRQLTSLAGPLAAHLSHLSC